MKKLFSLILTLAMILSALTVFVGGATSDGAHGYLPGDVNDDGEVTTKDVLVLRRYIAGIDDYKKINPLAADVNGDGEITTQDVLKLRRYIAGLDDLAGNNEDSKYKVDTITIGGRNIARYDILIPSDADECMTYSAKTLKNYIKDACGITLNTINSPSDADGYVIEYRLDSADEYSLGKEGYHVEVEDGNVVITCGTKRGCLYATYYLLEKLGWRFLTEDIEYLYEAENVDIPDGFEDIEVPVFEYRGLNQIGVPDYQHQNSDLTAIRLRLNAVDAKGSGAAANARYGGGEGNLYLHGHSYAYQEAVGMKLDEAGVTDLDSAEAMSIFGVYGYNTPERDALNLDSTQPCLTSDTTFEHIMAFNYLLYRERTILGSQVPGIHYMKLSCSPNDNTKFCTCTNCKAVYSEEGSIAGTVFRMSNRVAEAQREIMPGVGVYTIAYWDARNPPKYTRPEDDVCVCFCFGGCNNHTYDHVEECAEAGGNPRYPFLVWDIETQSPQRPDFNVSNVYDLDCYTKWTELTNNVYVWYYACNFAYYIAPCPNVLNIYNDYKYLASTGTIGIYTEGSNTGYTFEVLRGYLAARMMWDPYMSEEEFEAYLDEFLMIYYGDGWEYIKEYIYMQDICGNLQGCFMNNFDRPWNFYNKEYYGENFDHILELFNNAYDAANTAEQRTRIERARIHVYFLGLSATYESKWQNGSAAEKAAYKEKYTYLWNYIKQGNFRCVDIGASGIGGLDNFPKNADTVYDTMFWIQDGFYGDGR
jgi:hypothetical protein